MEPTNAAAGEVALFRYEVIAPLLALEGRRGELRAGIRWLVPRPVRGL